MKVIPASARANMLIAGSIVCIHLLRNFILYLGPRKNKINLLHWTKWIQMGALTWEKVCQLNYCIYHPYVGEREVT